MHTTPAAVTITAPPAVTAARRQWTPTAPFIIAELLAAAPDSYVVREHDAQQCLDDSKDLAEAKKRMGRGLLGIPKRPTDHTHSDDRWLRRIVG